MLYNEFNLAKVNFEAKRFEDTKVISVTASTKSTNNEIEVLKSKNYLVKEVKSTEFFIPNKDAFLKGLNEYLTGALKVAPERLEGTIKHIDNILSSVGCLFEKPKK